MSEFLHRKSLHDEFFLPEGCHILELFNTDQDGSCSIARARVEPGMTTQWHRLVDVSERYVILEGEGLVEIGDTAPSSVQKYDVVLIPPLTPQRITNTGDTDLVFLAVCTPRFTPRCYEELE